MNYGYPFPRPTLGCAKDIDKAPNANLVDLPGNFLGFCSVI